MKKIEKGFTLTEVLIVVVIIGVLATLLIPRFSSSQERGYVAEAVGMLSAIRQAEASYYLENSAAYTANLALLDLDLTAVKFTYAFDTTSGSEKATATRVGGGTSFNGKTIILKMDGTWDSAAATHPFKPNN